MSGPLQRQRGQRCQAGGDRLPRHRHQPALPSRGPCHSAVIISCVAAFRTPPKFEPKPARSFAIDSKSVSPSTNGSQTPRGGLGRGTGFQESRALRCSSPATAACSPCCRAAGAAACRCSARACACRAEKAAGAGPRLPAPAAAAAALRGLPPAAFVRRGRPARQAPAQPAVAMPLAAQRIMQQHQEDQHQRQPQQQPQQQEVNSSEEEEGGTCTCGRCIDGLISPRNASWIATAANMER